MNNDKIRDLCNAAIEAEEEATAKEQAPDYDRSAFFDGNQDDAYEAGEDRGATSGAAVLARKVLELLARGTTPALMSDGDLVRLSTDAADPLYRLSVQVEHPGEPIGLQGLVTMSDDADIKPGDLWESVDHPSREPHHGDPVGLCIVVGPNIEGRMESPRSHEMTCLGRLPGKRFYMHESARKSGQWIRRSRA